MRLNYPILAVVGYKASGKTTVIERLVPKLIKEGFTVATIKHIDHQSFSIDRKGSDTWKHSRAGANPVVAFSNNEISIIFKTTEFPLEKISELMFEFGVDILILEGFSSRVLNDENIGKIICVKNRNEYVKFEESAKGKIIAFCSFQNLGEPILNIRREFKVLADKALKFIRKRMRICEILGSLGGLDCGKCGRKTCMDLAEEIYYGTASPEECIVVKVKPKLDAKIVVNGKEIPIQPFVSNLVRRTVLGMISSLKKVYIKGDEKVYIEIST